MIQNGKDTTNLSRRQRLMRCCSTFRFNKKLIPKATLSSTTDEVTPIPATSTSLTKSRAVEDRCAVYPKIERQSCTDTNRKNRTDDSLAPKAILVDSTNSIFNDVEYYEYTVTASSSHDNLTDTTKFASKAVESNGSTQDHKEIASPLSMGNHCDENQDFLFYVYQSGTLSNQNSPKSSITNPSCLLDYELFHDVDNYDNTGLGFVQREQWSEEYNTTESVDYDRILALNHYIQHNDHREQTTSYEEYSYDYPISHSQRYENKVDVEDGMDSSPHHYYHRAGTMHPTNHFEDWGSSESRNAPYSTNSVPFRCHNNQHSNDLYVCTASHPFCNESNCDISSKSEASLQDRLDFTKRWESLAKHNAEHYATCTRGTTSNVAGFSCYDHDPSRVSSNKEMPKHFEKESNVTLSQIHNLSSYFDEYHSNHDKATQHSTKEIMEVYPGVYANFLGAQDAYDAIQEGNITSYTCPCCEKCIFCIADIEYAICPQCRVVTPLSIVQVDDQPMVGSNKIKHNYDDSTCGNVGLGFTVDDFF